MSTTNDTRCIGRVKRNMEDSIDLPTSTTRWVKQARDLVARLVAALIQATLFLARESARAYVELNLYGLVRVISVLAGAPPVAVVLISLASHAVVWAIKRWFRRRKDGAAPPKSVRNRGPLLIRLAWSVLLAAADGYTLSSIQAAIEVVVTWLNHLI